VSGAAPEFDRATAVAPLGGAWQGTLSAPSRRLALLAPLGRAAA
jgi:hypothetical protein